MFIANLITEDMYYIFSPLSLYDENWRWDDKKFAALPKNKLIIIECSAENWGMESFVQSLHHKLKEHNLNFLILSHNPLDHLTEPEIFFYPYYYHHSINSFVKNPLGQAIENNIKKYKLSCLNGCPRPHRILNYFKLLDRNYTDTYISMHSISEGITARDDDHKLDPLTISKWTNISKDLEHRSDTICTQGPDNEAYLDTYINLITETTISSKLFLTEKTWKPIAAGQLFLVVGNPGTISFLRSQGVDTFDDYIDHSYDSEPDFVNRLDKLYKSLDQLMLSNLEDIYKQTVDRRLQNSVNFFNGSYDSQYAKALIKCINMQN